MSTPLNGSLLRGFEILGLFSSDRPEITAALVQRELDLNAATAHRFLATLEAAGALHAVRRGAYRLGTALTELGRLAEETNPALRRIQPILDELRDRLNESVMVCRLSRRGPTCALVATADRPITVSIRTGTTLSLLNSAQGRLWLADLPPADRLALAQRTHDMPEPQLRAALDAMAPELDRIRAEGVARNAGDAEPDIGAVATPLRDRTGKIALTLSVFGPLNRFTPDHARQVEPLIRDAAARVTALLDG